MFDGHNLGYIRKFASEASDEEGNWIAEILVGDDKNPMAIELLNELHEKYPLIAKSIDYMKKIHDEDGDSSIF